MKKSEYEMVYVSEDDFLGENGCEPDELDYCISTITEMIRAEYKNATVLICDDADVMQEVKICNYTKWRACPERILMDFWHSFRSNEL